jgi:hypothetical protein
LIDGQGPANRRQSNSNPFVQTAPAHTHQSSPLFQLTVA